MSGNQLIFTSTYGCFNSDLIFFFGKQQLTRACCLHLKQKNKKFGFRRILQAVTHICTLYYEMLVATPVHRQHILHDTSLLLFTLPNEEISIIHQEALYFITRKNSMKPVFILKKTWLATFSVGL